MAKPLTISNFRAQCGVEGVKMKTSRCRELEFGRMDRMRVPKKGVRDTVPTRNFQVFA
jgi:hypothetical protein